MKKFRTRFKIHFKKRLTWKHPFVWSLTLLSLIVFGGGIFLVASGGQSLGADDSHIVLLSIDGKQQALPTRSLTVGDLIPKISNDIKPQDIVEPSLDTPISGDNFRVNVYRAKPLTIIDGNKKIPAVSAYREAREIVQKSGLEVFPEDKLEIARSEHPLQDGVLGEKVVITRSTPVYLNVYGNQLAVHTQAKTVAEILKEKNVQTIEGDTVQPSPDTPTTSNMQIFVTRLGKQIVTVEVAIPAPVETLDDPTLSTGSTSVRQPGAPGKKVVTYEVELKNGQEVSRKTIQEVTVTDPVKKVVARGTHNVTLSGSKGDWVVAAGIAPGDYQYVDYIVGRESGWCPTKWQGQVGYCPGYYQELHPTNSGYGYGLCQSTPANKMASAGGDWATNPVTQLRWCSSYATSRYGSWGAAYNHWLAYHNW